MTDPHAAPAPLPASPLWRRLAALAYDLLVMLALLLCVGYLCQRLTQGGLFDAHGRALTWWYQPLQGLVLAGYLLGSWLRGGQTLGMRPWRVRLRRRDGGALRWPQALLRLLACAAPLGLLALAPLTGARLAALACLSGWLLSLLTCLPDRRRRSLPDLVAGTELVRQA